MEYDDLNLRTINLDMSGLEDDDPIDNPSLENSPDPSGFNPNGLVDNPDEGNQGDDGEGFIEEMLKLKGISDPNKIKVQDESGAIVEMAWNDLSRDEQLAVLMMENGDPETRLDEEEMKLISDIREAGLRPEDYLKNLRDAAITQHQDSLPRTYQIDELSDDELYALDLMEKVGDSITDEELNEAIERAKENSALYEKQIEALRKHYKNLEDENRSRYEAQQQQEQEQRYQEFTNTVLDHIQDFSQNSGLQITLSTDDMNDLANFMLTRDETGVTDFGKMLNDPKRFTEAAFWALKGPEILNEFQTQMQEQFKRGYALGQGKGLQQKPNRVTIQTPSKKSVPAKRNNALEIDLTDESYLDF